MRPLHSSTFVMEEISCTEKKVIDHVVIVFSNKVGFFVIVHLNWCYVVPFRVAIGIGDKLPFDYHELHM